MLTVGEPALDFCYIPERSGFYVGTVNIVDGQKSGWDIWRFLGDLRRAMALDGVGRPNRLEYCLQNLLTEIERKYALKFFI